MTRLFAAALCVATMVAIATPGLSATIPIGATTSLAELIEGKHTIAAGDKLFDDFAYAPSPHAADPSQIFVTGTSRMRTINGLPTAVYGLIFTSGEFAAGGLSGDVLDSSLLFRVTVADPDNYITGVELSGTTVVDGSGDARIAESFANVSGPTLLIRQYRENDEIITSQTSDFVSLGVGVKELFVQKDISVEVPKEGHPLYDPANLAEVTTFTQLFYQTVIPEPSAVLLLGGMLGMAGVMRWRLG